MTAERATQGRPELQDAARSLVALARQAHDAPHGLAAEGQRRGAAAGRPEHAHAVELEALQDQVPHLTWTKQGVSAVRVKTRSSGVFATPHLARHAAQAGDLRCRRTRRHAVLLFVVEIHEQLASKLVRFR